MNKSIIVILPLVMFLFFSSGCKHKKELPMIDMDSIKTDGSYDDKYIFQKEIEKEEKRGNRYKKEEF